MNRTQYDIASHGNYHAFSINDKFFFYDIEKMNMYEIEEKFYNKLIANRNSDFFNAFIESLPQRNDISSSSKYPGIEPLKGISLNVAQVCNLSCVYCYGVDGEYGTKGMMSEEIAYKSVDFLIKESQNSPLISIIFFGGEPLLNFPLIKKVVRYSKSKAKEAGKEISYSITTNGTKFSPEVNKYLNDNDFSVTISFDGDENIQDKNRPFRGGKGSYDTIRPKVEEFLKSRDGKALGRATVTNHSENLDELKNKLREVGFKTVAATRATVSDFALENRDIERVNDEQLLAMLSSIEKEADEILAAVKNREDLTEYRMSPIFQNFNQFKTREKRKYACGVGRNFVGISITGELYPCHRFVGDQEFSLGTIESHKTEDRQFYNESFTTENKICSSCWAKYHCGGGGCIHDNKVTMGDISNINVEHCTNLKHNLKLSAFIYSILSDSDKEYLFK